MFHKRWVKRRISARDKQEDGAVVKNSKYPIYI
jgi:hypothetical protein